MAEESHEETAESTDAPPVGNAKSNGQALPDSIAADAAGDRRDQIRRVFERGEIERETVAYAERIAGNAPLTVKAAKAAINAWERGEREEDLRKVHTMVDECFDSEDYKEGRRAFREKRTPDFRGR